MKNTLYRLTSLLLCAVMLIALFPAVAAPAAAAENETVRYVAPDENGILRDVDPGFVTGASAVSDDLDNATKLGKPTNVHWDEDTPTLLWFDLNDPLEKPYTIVRVNLYKNGKRVNSTRFYIDTEVLYSKTFGVLMEYEYTFGTGSYYATVGALSETGKYASSDSAKSDTWKYTKPSAKYSRPTSVKWSWPTATWKSNYGDDVYYEVQFYFSPTKGGEKYQVASSINPGTSWEIFNDTVKYNGKGYYSFRVRTHSMNINEKCHSAWSDFSSAYYCSSGKKLSTPKANITTDAATGNIRVSWTKTPGAEKHRVYRAESKDGPYVFMKTTVSARTFTDTTAELGKTYYYKVRGLDTNDPFYQDGKYSSYSNVVKAVRDLERPTASITLDENGDPVISWETVEGAAKYYVYRATSKDGTYTHVKSAVSARSYTDTSAKAGTTYYYKVKAVHKNTASNSALSAAVSIKAE